VNVLFGLSPNPTLTYYHNLPLLMDPDPLIPCPAHGSILTSPRENSVMWKCRYCHAIYISGILIPPHGNGGKRGA